MNIVTVHKRISTAIQLQIIDLNAIASPMNSYLRHLFSHNLLHLCQQSRDIKVLGALRQTFAAVHA